LWLATAQFAFFPLGACTDDRPPGAASASQSGYCSHNAPLASEGELPLLQLRTIPDGYRRLSEHRNEADTVVTYDRIGYPAPDRDPDRIAIEVSAASEDPTIGYVTRGNPTVRCGQRATWFIVSDEPEDAGARHGITWIESGIRVTVYGGAWADEELIALADDVDR
jgi:hypothetical protein